jgi:hypothetical protein
VQFVAFDGEWVETTTDFSNDCINIVLGLQKPKGSWKKDPATEKQIGYLRGLGYGGPPEITKSQAKELIERYKSLQD